MLYGSDIDEMTPEWVAVEYLMMKTRVFYPYGHHDEKNRWYPVKKERASCCDSIKEPSRAHPYSLINHCRSMKHLCTLHNVSIKKVRFLVSNKGLPLLMALNDPWVNKYIAKKMSV